MSRVKNLLWGRWQDVLILLLSINMLFGGLMVGPAIADMIIQQLPSLDDLVDINATSPSDGDVLTYDAITGTWINALGSCNLTEIENRIDSLNSTIIGLAALIDGHTIDIAAINETVGDLAEEYGALNDLVSEHSDLLAQYGINITALESAVVSLQEDMSAAQVDISDLQSDVSDALLAISDLQSDVSDLQDRMDTAEADISDLQNDVASNSGNITGLKDIAIVYIIDGGGSEIEDGQKGHLDIPFNCTITGWTLLADQSGSIVIDVWKDTYANFPPTVADTIAGSEKPTLSSVQKNQDLSLGTWTTSVSAGDILAFNVDSCSTVTRVTLTITATRVI